MTDMFRVEECTNGTHNVMFRHTKVGEISVDVDGEYVFYFGKLREGFIRLWMLEAIAAELKRLNYGQVTA